MYRGPLTLVCPRCNSYSARIPEDFKHTVYCNMCFCELERLAANEQ